MGCVEVLCVLYVFVFKVLLQLNNIFVFSTKAHLLYIGTVYR